MLWVTMTIVRSGMVGIREEPADLVPEGLGRQDVQRAERLVHREDLGLGDERPGDAHPLLHAAGELAGIGVLVGAQAHRLEHLLQAGLLLLLGRCPTGRRTLPRR
jgi:hypothetical protein